MAPADSVKSVLTRSLLYAGGGASIQARQETSLHDYTSRAVDSINVLQKNYYVEGTGIWDDAWWNSGNALTTLADFASLSLDEANKLNIGGIMQNTWQNAQKTDVKVKKDLSPDSHMITARYSYSYSHGDALAARGFDKFINDFYDDEGWWAIGLIHAFDVTRTQEYLDSAVAIFEDMRTGEGGPCNGGIFWSKERKYVNAIANELYLAVAASLANRLPDRRDELLAIAHAQWQWFLNSGMINQDGLVNDGLDDNCQNNGQTTWSYNQGVVLGGLVELWKASADDALLDKAVDIAVAAINAKTTDKGVLTDPCEPDCGRDGNQFKGIFVRNVHYLNSARPDDRFKTFIRAQADSIWANDRDADGKQGVVWSGPADVSPPNGPSHSSALDALVAALSVAS